MTDKLTRRVAEIICGAQDGCASKCRDLGKCQHHRQYAPEATAAIAAVREHDAAQDDAPSIEGKVLLAEIIAGLDGVTEGPWISKDHTTAFFVATPKRKKAAIRVTYGGNADNAPLWGTNEMMVADAGHIARCDPDTMRSISSYVSSLEACVAALHPDPRIIAMREALVAFTEAFYENGVEMAVEELRNSEFPELPYALKIARAALALTNPQPDGD